GGGSIVANVTTAGQVTVGLPRLTVTGSYTQTAGTSSVAGSAVSLNVSGLFSVQGGTFTMAMSSVGASRGMQVPARAPLPGGGVPAAGNPANAGPIDIEGGSGPGGTQGTLAVNGNYTQTSTGELDVHLYSSSAYDVLSVTGLATLGGTLRILDMGGYTPSFG